MNKPLKYLGYVGVASMLSLAFAQDEQFDTVVVFGKAQKDGDASVESDEISNLQANTLQDIFQNTPSINVSGGRDVAQMVFVNGWGSTFSNTTIDGAYQSDYYHHAGYLLLDPALLKQVGINSGAGSALDGIGALNGSIKFETKSAFDFIDEDGFYGKTSLTGYSNGEGFKISQLFAKELSPNWGLLFNAAHADIGDFEGGSEGSYTNSGSDTTSYFAKLSANYEAHKLSTSYEKIERNFFGFARLNYAPGFTNPASNDRGSQSQARDVFAMDYNFAPGGDLIDFDADLAISRQRFNGVGNGAPGSADDFLEVNTLNLDLTNTSYLNDSTSVAYGVNIRKIDADFRDDAPASEEEASQGFFAQADVDLTETVSTSFGARFDLSEYTDNEGYNYEDTGFSPNISFAFAPNENWEFGVGYAKAFRGIGIREAIYLDASRGTNAQKAALEAEESTNLEASISYSSDNGYYADAKVYKRKLDNYLDPAIDSGLVGVRQQTLRNDGYEINFGYKDEAYYYSLQLAYNNPTSDIAEGSINNEYNLGDEGIGRFATGRRWIATVGRVFQDLGLNTGLNAEYQEGHDESAPFGDRDIKRKQSFVVWNAFAEMDVKSIEGLTVQLNIDNIFDKGYKEASYYDDERIYEEPGRQFRLGLSYEF